jgi:hypothetical protein
VQGGLIPTEGGFHVLVSMDWSLLCVSSMGGVV